MEVHEALAEISEIRRRLERCDTFRGYRSLSVAGSAVAAVAGAIVQSLWIPAPLESLPAYLLLWCTVAAIGVGLTGAEIVVRTLRTESSAARQLTRVAVEQFAPCLVAGALVTGVLATSGRSVAWTLPGLWSILFSLGVFASTRHLPRATGWIGLYYLVSGSVCLALINDERALSPWAMLVTFGAGQMLAAAILYCTLERGDDTA